MLFGEIGGNVTVKGKVKGKFEKRLEEKKIPLELSLRKLKTPQT